MSRALRPLLPCPTRLLLVVAPSIRSILRRLAILGLLLYITYLVLLHIPELVACGLHPNDRSRTAAFRRTPSAPIPGSVCVAGCAKNVGSHWLHTKSIIEMAASTFEEAVVVIFSDDGDTDRTRSLIQTYACSSPYVKFIHQANDAPQRTERLARCRNTLLQQCKTLLAGSPVLPEYMLMMDLDDVIAEMTQQSLVDNFNKPGVQNWSVMSANNMGSYRDQWALRTFDQQWMPWDMWACVGIEKRNGTYGRAANRILYPPEIDMYSYDQIGRWCVFGGSASVAKYGVNGRTHAVRPFDAPIPVISAFNGAAIYRMASVGSCDYGNGLFTSQLGQSWEECEHVAFHECLHKIGNKMFINPGFIASDPVAYDTMYLRGKPSDNMSYIVAPVATTLSDLVTFRSPPTAVESKVTVPVKGLPSVSVFTYPKDQDNFVSGFIQEQGGWQSDKLRLLCESFSRVAAGNFLDVGANIGSISLPMARCIAGKGDVISVEGMPDTGKHLLAGVRANRAKNIAIYQYALSNAYGAPSASLVMHLDPTNKGGSSIVGNKHSREELESLGQTIVRVPVTTLDAIADVDPRMQRVLVMKFDVEGFEGQVLHGARGFFGRFPPCYLQIELISEWLFKAHTPREAVLRALEQYGYSTARQISSVDDFWMQQRDLQSCIQRATSPAPPELEDANILACQSTWVGQLSGHEQKIHSQNGEDGVIEAIFKNLPPSNKFYVEFGSEAGHEINTRHLRESKGWTGLLMDGQNENDTINQKKAWIAENTIVGLFARYKVPKKFGLLSVDIDSYDYWVLRKILESGYRPELIITEVNSQLGADDCITVAPASVTKRPWIKPGSLNFGVSVAAMASLVSAHGYTTLYCESAGVNCFHVDSRRLPPQIHETCPLGSRAYKPPRYVNGQCHAEDGTQMYKLDCKTLEVVNSTYTATSVCDQRRRVGH